MLKKNFSWLDIQGWWTNFANFHPKIHFFFISHFLFVRHTTGEERNESFSSFLVTINISPQRENSLIKHLHFLLLFFVGFHPRSNNFFFISDDQVNEKTLSFFLLFLYHTLHTTKKKFPMHEDYELFIKMGAKRNFLPSFFSLFSFFFTVRKEIKGKRLYWGCENYNWKPSCRARI